jgi:hypothetical protein
MNAAELEEYAEKLAAAAPPLTPAQRDVLVTTFAGVASRTGEAA